MVGLCAEMPGEGVCGPGFSVDVAGFASGFGGVDGTGTRGSLGTRP
jgi:hypothetical protein